jgi:hypothetical protein
MSADPFVCDGCHTGDFHEFDHFCDVLDVKDVETPHAFAAWLANKTEWDGTYGPLDDPAPPSGPPPGALDRVLAGSARLRWRRRAIQVVVVGAVLVAVLAR